MPIITLTTDFGYADPFAGIMKGVMLSICPEADLVDLTHGIEPQNIEQASGALRDSWRYFPEGTIHVAVVDPGVGTERRAVAVQVAGHFFVGPDNGIFTGVIRDAGEPPLTFSLENRTYFLSEVSQSFHGRDVFAPVAAWIARGTPLPELGPSVPDLVMLEQDRIQVVSGKEIRGLIEGFDHFGNARTNITVRDIQTVFGETVMADLAVSLANRISVQMIGSYGGTSQGSEAALVNSSRQIEVFVNRGSIRERHGLKAGDPVAVFRKEKT